MAFLIFSLLYYFPASVLSNPKPDPDYLFVHLHSNRSTAEEVALDIHPAQLGGASKSPKSAAGYNNAIGSGPKALLRPLCPRPHPPRVGQRCAGMLGKTCGYSWYCCTYTSSMNCEYSMYLRSPVWVQGPVKDMRCNVKCTKPPVCRIGCPKILRPVCGSNGKTYDNKCSLDADACESADGILLKYEGPCIIIN